MELFEGAEVVDGSQVLLDARMAVVVAGIFFCANFFGGNSQPRAIDSRCRHHVAGTAPTGLAALATFFDLKPGAAAVNGQSGEHGCLLHEIDGIKPLARALAHVKRIGDGNDLEHGYSFALLLVV